MLTLYRNANMTPTTRARLIAERDYHAARAAELTAEISADAAANAMMQVDLTAFDPAWKSGIHLSKAGVIAILAAFDRRMRQIEIAKLFGISESAANHWHQRWQMRRQNP